MHASTPIIGEPYVRGINNLQFSHTVASWHNLSWRQILNFEHLPNIDKQLTLPVEVMPLKNELLKFKRIAVELSIKFHVHEFSLNEKQINDTFLPLLKEIELLKKPYKQEFKDLKQLIQNSSNFLRSRPVGAQENYFHELCTNILAEGFLTLSKVSGELNSTKEFQEFIIKSKSSNRTRLYSFMIKENCLRELEQRISTGVSPKELKKLIQVATTIWSTTDRQHVNLLIRDSQFTDLLDTIGRKPQYARQLIKLARLEFEWESWQVPDLLISKTRDDEKISKILDTKKISNLFNDPRKSVERTCFSYMWLMTMNCYPEYSGFILNRALAKLTKRNDFLMPEKDSLIRFSSYSKRENLSPPEDTLKAVIDLQERELADYHGKNGTNGMLRVISLEEIKSSLNSGSYLVCQWEGNHLTSFSIFNPDANLSNKLGSLAVDKLDSTDQKNSSYVELIVQSGKTALKVAREYQRGANYKLVLEATDSVLHAYSPTASITECAVCRTYPSPNLAMDSHIREGWQELNEIVDGDFRFAVIKRTVQNIDPRF